MTCKTVQIGDMKAIVCTTPERRRRCSQCGCMVDTGKLKLCDAPRISDPRRTCDRPLCEGCAVHPYPDRDIDFCREHAAAIHRGETP